VEPVFLAHHRVESSLSLQYFSFAMADPRPTPNSESSYIQFSRGSAVFTSTAPADCTAFGAETCTNLIRFLSVAQKNKVNLLATSWLPALESLGPGRSGEVSQSFLDARSGLAFKRPIVLSTPRSEEIAFNSLISEISVLCHPSISSHPNIVDLEGICWEVSRESAKVWPVLVFLKADLGSLKTFIGSDAEESRSFDTRLGLCIQIAEGILALHRSSEPSPFRFFKYPRTLTKHQSARKRYSPW